MRILKSWCNKPATYWQFWLPQSGTQGGIIASLIFFWIPVIVYKIFKGN